MAINDPNDPHQARPGDDFTRRPLLDSELQADPELREGPASAGRIVVYAAAVLVLLGVVVYGLNNSSSVDTANKPTPATTAQSDTATAPPVRDVTPNREPGTTTGAATAPAQPMQPAPPQQAAPTDTGQVQPKQ